MLPHLMPGDYSRTFCTAVSSVNGGKGGRVIADSSRSAESGSAALTAS